jgi:HEPN domain-containing protein
MRIGPGIRQRVDAREIRDLLPQSPVAAFMGLGRQGEFGLVFSLAPAILSAMEERTGEWLRQAEYDMDTADYMYEGGRYFYAVFMCHLAVEKTLKGLYHEKRGGVPPRTHSLVYLLQEVGIKPPEEPGKVIVMLSEASIPTRYPEDLAKVQQIYTQAAVEGILAKSKAVIAWIKEQL